MSCSPVKVFWPNMLVGAIPIDWSKPLSLGRPFAGAMAVKRFPMRSPHSQQVQYSIRHAAKNNLGSNEGLIGEQAIDLIDKSSCYKKTLFGEEGRDDDQ